MTDQPTDSTDRSTESVGEDARRVRTSRYPGEDVRPEADVPTATQVGAGASIGSEGDLPTPRSSRRWLLAAAGVALLATIGGVFVATQADDESAELAAGAPDRSSAPTCFYVPTNLPAGWVVQSFRASSSTFLAEICPCERGTWTDGDRTISAHRAANPLPGDAEGWEPWTGAPGGRRTLDESGHVHYWWSDGDGATSVIGSGFATSAEAEGALAGWVGAALTAPPGWREVERSSIGEDVVAVAQASGLLAHDDGSVVRFEFGPSLALSDGPDPFAVADGDGARVVSIPGTDRTLIGESSQVPNLGGAWPGGTVFRIGANLGEGNVSEGVTDAQLVALAGGFEPASAEAWRAYVEQIDTTELQPDEIETLRQTLIHPTIDGLVLHEGDPVPGSDDEPLAEEVPGGHPDRDGGGRSPHP